MTTRSSRRWGRSRGQTCTHGPVGLRRRADPVILVEVRMDRVPLVVGRGLLGDLEVGGLVRHGVIVLCRPVMAWTRSWATWRWQRRQRPAWGVTPQSLLGSTTWGNPIQSAHSLALFSGPADDSVPGSVLPEVPPPLEEVDPEPDVPEREWEDHPEPGPGVPRGFGAADLLDV